MTQSVQVNPKLPGKKLPKDVFVFVFPLFVRLFWKHAHVNMYVIFHRMTVGDDNKKICNVSKKSG